MSVANLQIPAGLLFLSHYTVECSDSGDRSDSFFSTPGYTWLLAKEKYYLLRLCRRSSRV